MNTILLFLFTLSALAGNNSISGVVQDRNGNPVDQAIVALKPGNVELVTDRDGKFFIDYLRNDEGSRVKLKSKREFSLEVFKVGFHTETRTFFYRRGPTALETIQLVEETIRIHDDNADLSETLDAKPTHSAGANYEGQ